MDRILSQQEIKECLQKLYVSGVWALIESTKIEDKDGNKLDAEIEKKVKLVCLDIFEEYYIKKTELIYNSLSEIDASGAIPLEFAIFLSRKYDEDIIPELEKKYIPIFSDKVNGILRGLLNYVHDSLDTILEDSIKVFTDDNK